MLVVSSDGVGLSDLVSVCSADYWFLRFMLIYPIVVDVYDGDWFIWVPIVGRSTGVESGGGGERVPRSRKISGGRPPKNYDISASFFLAHDFFSFSTIFKIKWPKSEEKLNFGGRWVWVPMNPFPPQTKVRDDAPGQDRRERSRRSGTTRFF